MEGDSNAQIQFYRRYRSNPGRHWGVGCFDHSGAHCHSGEWHTDRCAANHGNCQGDPDRALCRLFLCFLKNKTKAPQLREIRAIRASSASSCNREGTKRFPAAKLLSLYVIRRPRVKHSGVTRFAPRYTSFKTRRRRASLAITDSGRLNPLEAR